MSKQEIYTWISAATTFALVGLYVVLVIGLPESFEGHAAALESIFWKIIGLALLIRICLAVLRRAGETQIEKDERDDLIQLKGYRSAYVFVMSVLVTLVFHLVVSDYVSEVAGERLWLSAPYQAVHVLILTFLVAGILEDVTRLFYYRKDDIG